MNSTDELTISEQKAVEELRARMKNVTLSSLYEDESQTVYYKFLKARDFDVDKAEFMLRKCLTWRKSFQVDTILEDFKPKEFFLKYPMPSHLGFDKEGNFVLYLPMGKIDGRDVLRCLKFNDYMRHWVWFHESVSSKRKQIKEKTGKSPWNVRVIIDLDKLTFANATYKHSVTICLRLVSTLSDNYPECLRAMYVINAPSYYVITYSILKAVMSREMVQKFMIFGQDGWKKKLLEDIDADVLPKFLGGNRTDPDGNPLCTTFVSHAGKIPEQYYLPEEERRFKKANAVKSIHLPAGRVEEIFIEVTESGSAIQWEFLIHGKDIGFGLFLQSAESIQEILPTQRYETFDGTEEGFYKTNCAGKYMITFDNTHSWFSSKDVEYCITVVNPRS